MNPAGVAVYSVPAPILDVGKIKKEEGARSLDGGERVTPCSPPPIAKACVVGSEDGKQLGPQIAGADMLEE